MKPKRNTFEGTVWGFLAEAVALPTGLVTAAFLTRHLGPDGYGIFSLAIIAILWIETGINSFLSSTTVKFVSQATDWRPVGTTVLRLYLLVSVLAMLLVGLLAQPLANILGEPAMSTYLRLFALDLPLAGLANAHLRILIGTGQYQPRAVVRAVRWVARLVLIVVLVELGLSVAGAIVGSMGATLVELIVARRCVRPSLAGQGVALRPLFQYATPLFASGLALHIFKKMDLFTLKALGGTASDAGFYAAAQNLALTPSLFAFAFSPLLLSSLNHMLRTGAPAAARRLGRNALRIIILLFPLAGMSAGAAREVVRLIYGANFEPAAPLLALLIFVGVALALASTGASILVALGRPGWTLALRGPLVPLALGGHFLLIPLLGSLGAALVTTAGAGLSALVSIGVVCYFWQMRLPHTTFLRSAFLTILAYGASALWPTAGLWLVIKLVLIAFGILLLFGLLGEFSTRELAMARSFLRRRTHLTSYP